jgi:hypothetical protein
LSHICFKNPNFFLCPICDWESRVWIQGFVCKAGALPLEPHLQPILLWLFWRWGSYELFTQTCFPASWCHPSKWLRLWLAGF